MFAQILTAFPVLRSRVKSRCLVPSLNRGTQIRVLPPVRLRLLLCFRFPAPFLPLFLFPLRYLIVSPSLFRFAFLFLFLILFLFLLSLSVLFFPLPPSLV